MKKPQKMSSVVLILSGVFFSSVATVGFAAGNTNTQLSTVEACTRLLPSGHQYQLHIGMDINTSKKQSSSEATPYVISNGSFSLTDKASGPNVSAGEKAKVQPFVQCVRHLLK